MSIAVISYHSLDQASDSSKRVAKRLDDYYNQIHKGVYRDLQGFSTNGSESLTDAKNALLSKLALLETKSKAFTQYSSDLATLKEKCMEVDTEVKNKIAELTGEFKAKTGIVVPAGTGAVPYYSGYVSGEYPVEAPSLVDWEYGVGHYALTPWEKKCKDKQKGDLEYRFWQKYEGGQQLIKGRLEAGFNVVVGSIPLLLSAYFIAQGKVSNDSISGIFTGGLEVVNAVADWLKEDEAYIQTRINNDPALGRRLSNLNTLQDIFRSEASRKKQEDALALDLINTAAIISSVASITKNIVTRAKGLIGGINQLELNELFKGQSWKSIWENAWNGMYTVKGLFSSENFKNAKSIISNEGKVFLENIKNHYLEFSSLKGGMDSLMKNLEKVGNIMGLIKDIGEVYKDAQNKESGWGIKGVWAVINHLVLTGFSSFDSGANTDTVQIEDGNLHKDIDPLYQGAKQIAETWFVKDDYKDFRKTIKNVAINMKIINAKLRRIDVPQTPVQ